MFDYLLILLLSHFLTDFVFQTETLIVRKHSTCKKEKHKALLFHCGTFFMISFVLFLVIKKIELLYWATFAIIFILTLIHYLLDLIKVKIIETSNQTPIADDNLNKTKSKGNFESNCPLWLFLADQIAHIALIFVSIPIVFHILEPWYGILPVGAFFNKDLLVFSQFTITQKVLLTSSILILATSFANIFIKLSLTFIKLQTMTNEKDLKVGRYIGAIERILTAIAIVASTYEAVAILYASKTAVRFSQIQNNPEFSDYLC